MIQTELSPKDALERFCYTSERTFDGTIYTISDQRAGTLNGMKVISRLISGQYIFTWEVFK